jgi:hypothetical protein
MSTFRSPGRVVASRSQWQAIRRRILQRARWRCQACLRAGRLDVHHVIKRAHGGSDFDEDFLVALCRACHDRTDAPYRRVRLVIRAMGYGVFRFEYVWAADKWAVREERVCELYPSWAKLRSVATYVVPTLVARRAAPCARRADDLAECRSFKPVPGKRDLARRQRPNLKALPGMRQLDRRFARRVADDLESNV